MESLISLANKFGERENFEANMKRVKVTKKTSSTFIRLWMYSDDTLGRIGDCNMVAKHKTTSKKVGEYPKRMVPGAILTCSKICNFRLKEAELDRPLVVSKFVIGQLKELPLHCLIQRTLTSRIQHVQYPCSKYFANRTRKTITTRVMLSMHTYECRRASMEMGLQLRPSLVEEEVYIV